MHLACIHLPIVEGEVDDLLGPGDIQRYTRGLVPRSTVLDYMRTEDIRI